MQAITQTIASYCPLNSATTLPAFLFTELIPHTAQENTSGFLGLGDILLWQTRVFTKYDNEKIGYKGFVTNKTYDEKQKIPRLILSFGTFRSIGTLVTLVYLFGTKMIVLTAPIFTYVASMGNDHVDHYWRSINDNVKNLLFANICKSMIAVAWLVSSIFIIVVPFRCLNISQSKIALSALGYFATIFASGTALKLYAYHTNQRVKAAYDHYLEKKASFSLKPVVPDIKCTDLTQIAKENSETISILIDDILFKIISLLPVSDSNRFRGCNKWALKVVSNVITRKIYENFSTDFIEGFGLQKLLNVLWSKPIDSKMINFDNRLGIAEILFLNEEKVAFNQFMEERSIAWGCYPNSRKLFLCFKDKVETRNVTEFFLVEAHENSEVFWQDRAVKCLHYFTNRPYTVYKVDEDHYSINKDLTSPWITTFYRNFKPKAT